MKKIMVVFLAMVLACMGGSTSVAESETVLVYDTQTTDVCAYRTNKGEIMICVEDMVNHFGFAWSEESGTIKIDNGLTLANCSVGELSCALIHMEDDSVADTIQLAVAPCIKDGKLFVPMEVFSMLESSAGGAMLVNEDKIIIRDAGYFINGMPNPITRYNTLDELEKALNYCTRRRSASINRVAPFRTDICAAKQNSEIDRHVLPFPWLISRELDKARGKEGLRDVSPTTQFAYSGIPLSPSAGCGQLCLGAS